MRPHTAQPRPHRERITKPRVIVVAAVAGMLALVTACSGSGESSGSSDTLTLANAVKVDNIDPGANPAANETIWLEQNLWSRLVKPSADATEVEPALAKSWDISDDELTYTFHLRSAKFSDGSPITADDVAYSINRARANPTAWGFLVTAVKSITAPDSSTVVVKLAEPHAPLLADLAIYAFGVIPEKSVKAAGSNGTGEDPTGTYFTETPIVTSGPFYVASYEPNSEVVLKANKYFWGDKPRVNTLNIKVIPNDNDRVLALQSGDVDVIENPPVSQRDQINANPNLAVDYFNSTRVDMLLMNNKNKYLSNIKVRHAIRYALDMETMNDFAYKGKAVIGTSPMPYKMLYWNDNLKPWPRDVDMAKQLLADAGYPNGFSLDLITVSGDTIQEAKAVSIQDSLKEIGINVEISSYELQTAYNNEDKPDYDMGFRYWTNDIIDPDEVASFLISPASASNLTNWENPEVAKLVVQARKEGDKGKRAKLYDEVQQLQYEQMPFIPLLYPPFSYARGEWVDGFEVSPLGTYQDALLTSLTVQEH